MAYGGLYWPRVGVTMLGNIHGVSVRSHHVP